uniref:Folylpolyglutamate synthase n=1 Tax=Tetraselmis chuii TaxID=63592 RepID=A0A7S1X9P1_9CHLO
MQKREPMEILAPLHSALARKGCHMDHAFFVPLDSCVTGLGSGAQKAEEDLAWQNSLGRVWEQLRSGSASSGAQDGAADVVPPEVAGAMRVVAQGSSIAKSRSTAMPALSTAVDTLRAMSSQKNLRVRVLVTGSLYLVGDMIKLLKGGAV